jgi:hypothetical protein
MATDRGAPSLVALAAAFRSLEVAALRVRGVCDRVERLHGQGAELGDDEAVRLWAFAERTRVVTSRLRQYADDLADMLLMQFFSEGGGWPLTSEQEQEYREVLATLASREAEAHREGPASQSPPDNPRPAELDG